MDARLKSTIGLAERAGRPIRRIRKLISGNPKRHNRVVKSIMIPTNAFSEYLKCFEVKPEIRSETDG